VLDKPLRTEYYLGNLLATEEANSSESYRIVTLQPATLFGYCFYYVSQAGDRLPGAAEGMNSL
jgi:hypothetical protein